MASPTVIGTPVSSSTQNSADFDITTYTHTDSGENNALIVLLLANGGSTAFSAITWNGASLTKLTSFPGVSSGGAQLWYLADPDEGNNTLSLTYSASSWQNIAIFSLQDCAQSTPLDTSGTANGSSTSGAKSITTGEDDTLILSWASIGVGASSISADGSQTNIVSPTQPPSDPWGAFSSLPKDTAGAQSTGYSWTTSSAFDVYAASLKYVAPTGSAFTPKMMTF